PNAKPGSTLPKRVYILEDDSDLIPYTDTDTKYMEDGDLIGTYELVEVSRVVVTRTMEPVKADLRADG
ncbi:hypothetical protein KKA53_05150, partial [Candidatus Dependentiae bacterium]|nr:hypothetical protein [Candidatus Dependentiae bacterium]